MKIILIGLGLGFLGWGYSVMKDARASLHWPKTSGKILKSEFKSYDSKTDGKSTTMYSADILYQYTINGKSYLSTKIYVGDYSSSNSKRVRKLVNRFKRGSIVEVYYNPQNSKNVVLIPGGTLLIYVPLLFGFLMSFTGLISLIFHEK